MQPTRPTSEERDSQYRLALTRRLKHLEEVGILAPAEVEEWETTGRLTRLASILAVQDAVAGAFQETQIPRDSANYNRCRVLVGLEPLSFEEAEIPLPAPPFPAGPESPADLTAEQSATLSNTICGDPQAARELEAMGLIQNLREEQYLGRPLTFFELTERGADFVRRHYVVSLEAGEGSE